MPSFSHTKIGSFETCPLQYKYAYIDRIKVEVEDTVETFLGSRVHEALEKLYRDKKFERLMSLEELLAYYNKLWKEEWKDSVVIAKKEYTQENYRKIGERCLSDYYKRHKPFDRGRIIGLETTDFLPLDEEGKYKFHIRIDRLMDMGNGVYEVHDYKTGSSLPKQEELDQDRQLAMYSLWVRQQFKDFKKVRLVWHYVAFDKEMDSYRTKEQLAILRKETLEKIKKVESAEEFPANVSWLCDWCLYKGICPMWKHEVQLEEKPENEYLNDPGLKLVDEYVRIKEELDEHRREAEEKLEKLKQALITFCAKEGVSAVFGSENKITVKEYEYVKFPGKNTEEREELIKVLQSIGKLGKVSDLDVYVLARILKNKEWDEHQLDLLRKFETREKSHRLSISKK
ncbi:MAG: PD-(D/E)XK nuclease family protein [Candidatus Aminicenantes bacterium]|nr:MAG: PD-(D/E)XK nuclease family protein [Candidatus Aminicenantes bacterium]